MKRRIVSMMLVAAMGTALLAGCGGNTANSSTAEKSNDKAAANEALPVAIAEIEKAASKGIFHKNAAARKVSHITKAVNAMA